MSKYLNTKTEVDGILFDSKKEAKYYLVLKTKQKLGEISNLRRQVAYELIPPYWVEKQVQLKTKTKTIRYCAWRGIKYIADFVYTDNRSGDEVVVDVKGFRTREYNKKKKLMNLLKDIEIQEV